MRLPAPLLRNNPRAHKNDFGHVLILAGSANMMGAGALCALASMRAGAGLTTLGIPKSLNAVAQKKISPVIMTFPLRETTGQTLSLAAYEQIRKSLPIFSALALGPGLSTHPGTARLILKIIENSPLPLVIDADALNILSKKPASLLKTKTPRILTPHAGEMSRLTGLAKKFIEKNRIRVAKNFARQYNCTLLLKGHHTVVASPDGKIYVNHTGNAGMATAGSGDVLTGMIASFLAQGVSVFDAAKYGAYLHGKAGDLAAQKKSKLSMIATDIIDQIPSVILNR